MPVRPRDQSFPIPRRFQAGGRNAEIDVIVIGQNIQHAVADIDAVLATHFARRDKDRVGGGIVRRHKPHFAGHIIAGRDDDPILLHRNAHAHAKADVRLFIQKLCCFRIVAQPVIIGIVGAPVFIGQAVNNAFAVVGPDDVRQRAGDDVFQLCAGAQIADMQLKPFAAIIVIGIGQQLAIGADFSTAKAEILFAIGQFVFVEDQFVGPFGLIAPSSDCSSRPAVFR